MAKANPNLRKVKITGAVKRLFNLENPDARCVLSSLIKQTGIFTPTTFDANPYQLAFKEGQRHVVCSLIKHLTTDIEQLVESIRALERENETES